MRYYFPVFLTFVLTAVLIILLARHLTVISFLANFSGDAIHENIYINGTAVGGLTSEEAAELLQKEKGLDRRVIGFFYDDRLVHSFTFTDFGAEYDFSMLIEQAHQHGRIGSRRDQYRSLRALSQSPFNVTGEPSYHYDEAMIPERLDAVRDQAGILPTNATMRMDSGWSSIDGMPTDSEQFTITEGTPGRTPDIQKAQTQLKSILAKNDNDRNNRIDLEMLIIHPTYNAQHFAQAQSLLGRFSTEYWGGEESARSINIRLATSHLHNSVVFPGETFSTREAVGPSTPERGYELAAVIVGGQLVEDYGGGICQVASTLYNALLYSELDIIARANHSLKVHYLDSGFDAAIAGDYMDLKFKNNHEYPVLIAASAQNGILEVRIYGHETRPSNRTMAFVSELIEVIPPEPERVLVDENMPSGHVLINTEPQNGYKYELFRIVFIDGEQVSRERVNVSVYRPIQGVITRGP